MSLVLEIEWLDGVCRARRDPAYRAPEWPVGMDRVFSALVATWGAAGEPADGREALTWLERQSRPVVTHVDATARDTREAYVPVNDQRGGLAYRRVRQPRHFAESVLAEERIHLAFHWAEEPAGAVRGALDALARDTSYVGHSSSLVRMRFATANGAPEATPTDAAPYPGRLDELVALHRRHVGSGDPNARPRRASLPAATVRPSPSASVFGANWIVFAHHGGMRPEPTAAAVVGGRLRAALMAAFRDPVPEWLSGHRPDGTPTDRPHSAFVPLLNAGHPHGDGRLMGVALVLARAEDDAYAQAATPPAFDARRRLDRAVAALAVPNDPDRAIDLHFGRHGSWRVIRDVSPGRFTLQPSRYAPPGGARQWTTVTPIVLDRHVKDAGRRREAEADGIAEACINIGLPRPERVVTAKHSAATGAPPAWPVGGAPGWTAWRRPESLGRRPMTHATIVFAEPVEGPVLLGAGRFVGLGLCMPLDDRR